MRDTIYSKPLNKISPFVFDKRVAHVFDDMINRSVPGYTDIIHMCGVLAVLYVKPHTRVYDLGCSLGAASHAVLQAVPEKKYELVAVDSSQAMIEKSKLNLKGKYFAKVLFNYSNVETTAIKNASFVMLNFVSQFIQKDMRFPLLTSNLPTY